MVQNTLRKDAPSQLEVLVDAQVAVENVTRYANSQGYQVEVTPDGGDFKLSLSK
jgi:TusA-related sulfurtransferase